MSNSATPWTAAYQAPLFSAITQSLLKFMSLESVMLSNHLILCHPLHLLPSIFPSIKVFSSELAVHIRWPKYWSFNFTISPSNEYSGLISFRTDWFDSYLYKYWWQAKFLVQIEWFLSKMVLIEFKSSFCSVVSDSLQPYGLQLTRCPCPSSSFWVHSNSCPLSWRCHPTISSSVVPFSSCPQSFPASGKSQLFQSGGQSIGVSDSTSVLPLNSQGWFPLGLIGLISLLSKRFLRVFLGITIQFSHSVMSNSL